MLLLWIFESWICYGVCFVLFCRYCVLWRKSSRKVFCLQCESKCCCNTASPFDLLFFVCALYTEFCSGVPHALNSDNYHRHQIKWLLWQFYLCSLTWIDCNCNHSVSIRLTSRTPQLAFGLQCLFAIVCFFILIHGQLLTCRWTDLNGSLLNFWACAVHFTFLWFLCFSASCLIKKLFLVVLDDIH